MNLLKSLATKQHNGLQSRVDELTHQLNKLEDQVLQQPPKKQLELSWVRLTLAEHRRNLAIITTVEDLDELAEDISWTYETLTKLLRNTQSSAQRQQMGLFKMNKPTSTEDSAVHIWNPRY